MKIFFFFNISLYLFVAFSGAIAQAHSDQEQSEPQRGSVGIVISVGDNGLQIVDVFYDTPAAAAGLVPGDYIWAIDGNETTNWDLARAVDAIRGEIGSIVTLTIRRSGVELAVPLMREWIGQPARAIRTQPGFWYPTNR